MILLICSFLLIVGVIMAAVVYAVNEQSKQWAESEN